MKMLPLDTEIKAYDIYLLVSESTLECYVWKVKQGNTYDAYIKHVSLKFSKTKSWFERCIQENKLPTMYRLETMIGTKEEAFRCCIAWTKHFINHGYKSVSAELFLAYCDDMLPETREIYNAIKNTPLEAILCPEKILVGNYKKRTKKKGCNKTQITVYISQKEFERITDQAKNVELSVSAYCKNMALSGRICTLPAPQIFEALAELRDANNLLRQMLSAAANNAQHPREALEDIQSAVDHIMQASRDIVAAYRENTRHLSELQPK